MFYLIPFFLITPYPSIWKQTLGFQITKFSLGLAYAFTISYFGLVDKTLSALLVYGLFAIIISLLIDVLLVKIPASVGNALSIVLFVCIVSYLYLLIVHPLAVKQDLAKMTAVNHSEDHLKEMNLKHLNIVPSDYARYEAEKVLGKVKNYSYYDLGDTTIQKIDNELFWVTPIEFKSFFKANKGQHSPGYIKMNAENPKANSVLVDDYKMKYIPSNYFSNNLARKVRSKYPSIVLIGTSFEPDESGRPHYVVSYGHYHKFRQGKKVDGAIIVDPQSGEIEKYKLEDVPEFVDQVIPPDLAADYNTYFGKYSGGFWNSIFDKTDVHVPTSWETSSEQVVGVFSHDNDFVWFTDHTRDESDSSSMVGYSTMDGRTGELTYYTNSNVKGALDGNAAVDAVVGSEKIKKAEYIGTQPLLYRIYGKDTWIVPLIDEDGLFREIAFVSSEDGKIFGHAPNKADALENYKYMVTTESTSEETSISEEVNLATHKGKILRSYQTTDRKGEVFKLLIEGSDKIFTINPKRSPFVGFAEPGDEVEVKYIETKNTLVTVQEFYNKTIKN